MQAGARVLLVGDPDDLGALEGFAFDRLDAGALGDAELPVAILDRRAFASVEAMRAARQAFAGRVLYVADPESAVALALGIGADDDLSLIGEPREVVAYRVARLVGPRDALTGLARRAGWELELARMLADASPEQPTSIVLLDVDRFKAVNDEHGHAKGDAVLSGLAHRLLSCAKDARVIARLGGELFGVLLAADEARATERAEAMLEAVRAEPIEGVAIRWSAGVATATEPMGPRELHREADEALYSAKARGRDRVVHASASVRESQREGTDAHLESFEDFTRVIAERVAEVIARRGRRLFSELREQADVDALTDLYSRRYLDRRLPFEVEQAEGGARPLTIALLDIDHFGAVNKGHGWPTGDKVLAAVSDATRGAVRESDWVARYGGEELCVVLADTRLASARKVLERIRTTIETLRVPSAEGETVGVTVSIGAAERGRGEPLEALFERVSDRLLEAKGAGRNCTRT